MPVWIRLADGQAIVQGMQQGPPLIAIVGTVASGKTHLRAAIHAELGLDTVGIDDMRKRGLFGVRAWDALTAHVNDARVPLVVESCVIRFRYMQLLLSRPSTIIQCIANSEVRARRIAEREGLTDARAQSMAEQVDVQAPSATMYDTTEDPDVTDFVRTVIAPWVAAQG